MKLYAVMGETMEHTLSPQIHTRILQALDMVPNYCVLEIARKNLPDVIRSAWVLGFSGMNVTIPYKEEIMPYLDEISQEAQAVGAVNTIHFHEGKTIGHNTDYFGFARMLQRAGMDPAGKPAVVYGAGGAAKALVACLRDSGAAEILVVSRNVEKLDALRWLFPSIKTAQPQQMPNHFGGLFVNATPVGMYPNTQSCVISQNQMKQFEMVADIVYNPFETQLVKQARDLGIPAVSGLYMLVEQAVKAQEIYQQINIDAQIGETIYHELCQRFL